MKSEKAIIGEYIHFFLSDADRAAAILNKDGTISQVNERFHESFGLEKTGKLSEYLDETSERLWNNFFSQVDKKGHGALVLSVQFKSQKMNSVKVRLIYCDVLKKVIAIFNVPRSIKQDEELTIIKRFQNTDNLMFIVNKEGVIVNVNKSTDEFYNLPPDYFIGNPSILRRLLQVSDAEATNLWEKILADGFAEVLTRHERTPGDVRYYQYNAYHYEETQMFLVRVVDYTEKINQNQQLAQNESLLQTSQMAASIAHEIRNPMTTLKGFTQLLRGSASEESKKYLDVIDDEIIRMESILSEMLNMAKPKKIEKTLISLGALISEMINIVQPTASVRGISVIHDEVSYPEVSIYGDGAKLKQALLNIFKNGLEAMTAGGVLTIGIEEGKEDQINLTVTDTGKGMTITQLKQIFMPFFTTRSEGTGLGLPFVIQTIENHGGTISVSSEVGLGSKFTLSFPRASTRKASSDVARELSQSGKTT